MGLFRRAFDRLAETDEERLADETRAWASTIPSCTSIADAPLRSRVTIAGVIRRITVLPMEDNEALEVLVTDGTGEAVVQFMGRRSIAGLGLGTRVVVEGVLGEDRGVVKMRNPRLELSA
ncbi:MAG TPA: DNA-binding protein [Actinomycetota bacterium]|nr:DNA-binding protein [Actinomycetota bacterium]